MSRPRVLVLQDWFLPGFRGGGSLRSVANLVARLGDEFQFSVVARDRDFGSATRYPGLRSGWSEYPGCRVRYLSPADSTPWGLRRALHQVPHDLVYLNSFFATSTVLFLMLRRLGLLPPAPTVLAPRGELAPQALALKSAKKSAYLRSARMLSLLRGVVFHASTAAERQQIRRCFDVVVEVAIDLPAMPRSHSTAPALPAKAPDAAHFVFFSRVSRKKNLAMAVDLVGGLRGDVTLEVYGPREDPLYWRECEILAAALPSNVRFAYRGEVPHAAVGETLSRYHFMLLPTRDENFGHVVLEALQVGLPVVLSDRTPWRQLEQRGVGFDIPLHDKERFRTCLQQCVAMPGDEHREMSRRARELAHAFVTDPELERPTREMFRGALAMPQRGRGGDG